jgi:hypothetical protein
MCQSFVSMGAASAEHEIELAEQSPSTSIHSEIKPFTTKVDSHVIEALDIVAGSMGISRNTLVVKLINHYLPFAFDSFHGSRYSVFEHVCSNMPEKSSEQFVLSTLESLIGTSDVSEEAKAYLKRGIVGHVIGEDYL